MSQVSILNNEKYLTRNFSKKLIKSLVDEDINKRMGYIEIKEKLGIVNVNLKEDSKIAKYVQEYKHNDP